MADEKYIEIKGAREHNLKNIDISIPKDKLTVITGLSARGSLRWLSTRFTPRGSAVMWRAFPPMRASFWS